MADLASISAVLSSVKTATDLARIIKDSDISLSNAEAKFQMAELICALADVKLELAEVQSILVDKDAHIFSLESQLKEQRSVKFDGTLYYAEGDNTPFCPVCYEGSKKLIHLTHYDGTRDCEAYDLCKTCNQTYG